jgi:hypothetical protein
MFNATHTHRTATTLAAGAVALTGLLLAPARAQASRIPADPITFVATPLVLAQMTADAHTASVRAALQDLQSDRSGQ